MLYKNAQRMERTWAKLHDQRAAMNAKSGTNDQVYWVLRARDFAIYAHGTQERKYTGDPYWYHCQEVAYLVALHGYNSDVISAAWLHDVVEDTDVTMDVIRGVFNMNIAGLVWQLTDQSKPSDGNRATRKAIDRAHSSRASFHGQTIKYADIISNAKDIAQHDPDFAKVYGKEMRLLLEVMTGGDGKLYEQAAAAVENL
jgi:(p)ppGpp synthase/HD superfamily hydrolase